MPTTKTRSTPTVYVPQSAIALVSALVLLVGPTVFAQAELEVTNHKTVARLFWSSLDGDHLTFPADESSDQIDYNGDGELRSSVVQVLDLSDGTMTNVGIGNRGPFSTTSFVRGDLVWIPMKEDPIAQEDWNGDSDLNDVVPWLHRISTGSTFHIPIEGRGTWLGDEFLALSVNEAGQGVDLNGDLDLDDLVAHTYDAKTGLLKNHMLAVFRIFYVGANTALYFVEEEAGADHNGDGDSLDRVAFLYEKTTDSIRNLGIAVRGGGLYEDFLILTVSEAGEQTDLNGDGDIDDEVIHVLEPGESVPRNLGLTTLQVAVNEELVAFGVNEIQQGADLNEDGDLYDRVEHVYDRRTRLIHNVGVVGRSEQVGGSRVAFGVIESSQGNTDLNGDGDTLDLVIHVFDPRKLELTNLGLSVATWFSIDEKIAAFRVSEVGEGVDLDGDDEIDDNVLHIFDVASGEIKNLGIDSQTGWRHGLGRLAFYVDERRNWVDLNGDNDSGDNVVHVFDGEKVINLGLHGQDMQFDGTTLALLVREENQGYSDIDGNGHVGGTVLHTARFVQLDPVLLIEELLVDVEELIGEGEISFGRGRSLMAELQVALWFLEFKNGERIAAMRIELFIKKVENLLRHDQVDPDIGNELLVKARQILEILQS